VQIDGDALLVDEGELLDAIMNVADGDDRRALAALYFGRRPASCWISRAAAT
jgi:hypothetical protein